MNIAIRTIVSGLTLTILLIAGTASSASERASPQLYIGWPNDGEVISNRKFRIWFGLRNLGVAPAGVDMEGTGHHHLLINTPLPALDEEIPADQYHIHFGAGQSETLVELPPGQHTLQLIMGDHNHVPHNPPVISKQIRITVR